VNILRIGFFVYEYPPAIVGGLGTYAENVTQEYINIGHEVSVFTLNGGTLKTREILTKDALTRPNATVINRDQLEERQLHQLSIALKQELLKEIREERHETTKQ
jgi:hypothetical protein